MNLHVVAYPELSESDNEWIQAYRKEYNSLYHVIAPHFTLVFSLQDMTFDAFANEVRKQAKAFAPVHFCLRCAVVNKDAFSDNYDVFLVPDEGHGEIVRLHDKLYSGAFAAHHRMDISYIPHISIANSTDVHTMKTIADEWNKKDFAIKGIIAALDIINYENRIITTLERVALK
jgi:2'-5' RNA ligase